MCHVLASDPLDLSLWKSWLSPKTTAENHSRGLHPKYTILIQVCLLQAQKHQKYNGSA